MLQKKPMIQLHNFSKIRIINKNVQKSQNIDLNDSIQKNFSIIITKKYKTFDDINKIKHFWRIIRKSIIGYLFHIANQKTFENRYSNLELLMQKNFKEINLTDEDYFVVKKLSFGSSFYTQLIYYIKSEQLIVQKLPLLSANDNQKLFERERKNYLNINYTFLPRYFGRADYNDQKGLLIEYINGRSLENIADLKLSFRIKIKILFEVLMSLCYLHEKGFIYRDLKPSNVF